MTSYYLDITSMKIPLWEFIKYQCPTHCGVNHPHLVYYDREITGDYFMYIDKSKLKEKYNKKRYKKKLSNKK